MTAIVDSPKATGAIDSINAAVTTVKDVTPSSDWVGRIIVLTNGAGYNQWREIKSVSGQNLTLEHSWDTSPIVGYTDNAPSQDDTFAISYTIDELVTAYSGDFIKVGESLYDIEFARFSGGAYLFITDITVRLRTSRISLWNDGGLICGTYFYRTDQDAIPIKSCNLLDYTGSSLTVAGKANSRRSGNRGERETSSDEYTGLFGKLAQSGSYPDALSSTKESGILQVWGGKWKMVTSTTDAFFYPMSTNGNNVFRLVNLDFSGGFGVRFTGTKSAFVSVNAKDKKRGSGINPVVDIARFELSAISFSSTISPIYFWIKENVPNITKIANLAGVTNLLYISTSGHSSQQRHISIDISEKDLDTLTRVTGGGSSAKSSNTISISLGKNIKPVFLNSDLTVVNTTIKTNIAKSDGTSINAQTLTSGDQFVNYFAKRYQYTGYKPNLLKSEMAKHSPFILRSISYTKQLFSQSTQSEEDFFNNLILFDDDLISETDKATVDAYATIDTAAKLYDRAKAYLVDNYAGETSPLVSRVGQQIDAGALNVVIDATASSVFSASSDTITIKATTFTGDITTTGTVTFQNGSKVVGAITDSTGFRVSPVVTFKGVKVGSSIYVGRPNGTTIEHRANVTGNDEKVILPFGELSDSNAVYSVVLAGHTKPTGALTFAQGSTVIDVVINQDELKFPDGTSVFTNIDSSNMVVNFENDVMLGKLTGDMTGEAFFSELELALQTEHGGKWVTTNPRPELLKAQNGGVLLKVDKGFGVKNDNGSGTVSVQASLLTGVSGYDKSLGGSVSFAEQIVVNVDLIKTELDKIISSTTEIKTTTNETRDHAVIANRQTMLPPS